MMIEKIDRRIFKILDQIAGHSNPAAEKEIAELRRQRQTLDRERLHYLSQI